MDIDPNLFFLPPAGRGLRGHPNKDLQGASHHRRRGSAISVRVMKYWNKLSASVVTAPSVNVFKKRLENVWTELSPPYKSAIKLCLNAISLSTNPAMSLSPCPAKTLIGEKDLATSAPRKGISAHMSIWPEITRKAARRKTQRLPKETLKVRISTVTK